MGFKDSIKRTVNSIKLGAKKHKPEIFFGLGVVSVIGGTVLACKQAMDLPDILKEHKRQMEIVHDPKQVPETEKKKLTTKVYFNTAAKIVKKFSLPVAIEICAFIFFGVSFKTLKNENKELAATCANLAMALKNYREGVVDRYGEEVDYQIANGIKKVEVEETVTDEKGKEKKVKKEVEVCDPGKNASIYTKWLTQSNCNWNDNDEIMLMFIRGQQNWANDILHSKGHVTLNEVYKLFDFKETKTGMIAGWIDDPKYGDAYVEITAEKVNTMNEAGQLEAAWKLDFNVDGSIYERMI